MIVGTAGHIDHGKTDLVRALTGVDTDRLPEERRRGITIELGFAPLALRNGVTAGVVDVPGHEALVRTMVAGATGFDAALLVVAADDGIMPQTREHLAILSLLGVRRGVVAITKCDLVDADWRAMVAADLRAALADTPFEGAAIVGVSTVTGEGIEELREALASVIGAGAYDRGAAGDLFRLPVDRAFTVKGTGTVVTGTVWSGTVARDAAVRILPAGRVARVRGIESHGEGVDLAAAGSRTALALAGVEVGEVARGQVIVADDAWKPATALRADVSMLAGTALRLGPRTRLRLHLGTVEVGARVVVAGEPLGPLSVRPARIVLDAPLVARAGDRFVLRGGARITTVGGGVVTDPQPLHRRSRPWPRANASASERLEWLLDSVGKTGLPVSELPVLLGLSPAAARDLLTAEVTAARAARDGARVRSAGAQAAVARRLAPAPSGAAEPSPALAADRAWILERLLASGAAPPSGPELAAERGHSVLPAFRILEKEGLIVAVERDRWYHATVLEALLRALAGALGAGAERTPSELRELLGVSRKFVMPILEFCDRQGYTLRTPRGRLAGPALRGHGTVG